MARTAVTGFTEAYVHTDPFYRRTYQAVLRRTASSAGVVNAPVTRTNLIVNPTFEVDTTGWAANGGATIARTTTQQLSGAASLLVTSSVTDYNGTVLTNRIPVFPGLSYSLSAYCRNVSGSTRLVYIGIQWYSASGTYISELNSGGQGTLTTAAGWVRRTVSGAAPLNAVSAQIFMLSGTTGLTAGWETAFDAVLFEQSATVSGYFDGVGSAPFTNYTLKSIGWNGTANNSTSTAVFHPNTVSNVTQLRLGGLTDFSFPYRFGGRFYLGRATVQTTGSASALGSSSTTSREVLSRTATASGTGSSTVTSREVLARTASASGAGSSTVTFREVLARTATASGTGSSTVTYIEVLARTATASGAGSSTASGLRTVLRTATVSGSGTSSSSYLVIPGAQVYNRTATGSGTGTSSSSYLRIVPRTATASGTGSGTASRLRSVFRTATVSGTGSSTVAFMEVLLRTATANGTGTSSATRVRTSLRTANASGAGTSSSTRLRIVPRTATVSGTGSSSVTRLLTIVRTATASGIGSSATTSREILFRTATASAGTGSSVVVRVITKLRQATAAGVGTSSGTALRTVIKTGTASGSGTSSGIAVVSKLRTATGSASGTSTCVGARVSRRTATANGQGGDTFATWMKSHIFRVPYTYTYPGGSYKAHDAENRLQRYNRTNVRARNLYKLTDGSYTITDQRNQGQVAKLWLGGRDHFLSDEEVVELTAAGFGASIT